MKNKENKTTNKENKTTLLLNTASQIKGQPKGLKHVIQFFASRLNLK